MTTAEPVFAPAKVNLTLHVTGQRADGYHLLDSLVVFADVGDRMWLSPGTALSLQVTGPFAAGVPTDARNLVWQAAELAGWHGTIHLEKNLPHGGGIGGGSADAAALLGAVGSRDSGLSLGADVPVCRICHAVRMAGIGEDLTPVAGWPALPAVLVNPGVQVPTPDVFAGLTKKTNAPMGAVPEMPTPELALDWLSAQRNDLEAVAIQSVPIVGEALAALGAARFARMSGSGATCFGLYGSADAATEAAKAIAAAHPSWWVQAVTLR